MRKIVVLAAAAAVIAAAAGLWSTATFDKPKVAGQVQATEAPGAPVSPHEIMSNRAESSRSNTGPISSK
jgi:hypothetical protein